MASIGTGCGGFQGYFFPDNISKSKLLPFNKTLIKREKTTTTMKESTPHPQEQLWRLIPQTAPLSYMFFQGIEKCSYRLAVYFLHQLSHLVLIFYHAHCLGCQPWIPPVLLHLLVGLFRRGLDFCCQFPLLCLPLA